MPITPSPLRYPGGKTKLTPYLKEIIFKNALFDGHYIEPYAGGAGLAINLLLKGYTRFIHLNDLDRSIYAFWYTVLNYTEELCEYIDQVDISFGEWEKQREIQSNKVNEDLLTLGISTFFMNRTNRSGIVSGGVIGGYGQTGKYKLDARFNKSGLIKKIRMIAFYKSRITISNEDAMFFLENRLPFFPEHAIVNFDPPYYVKGQMLYQNSYDHSDHYEISKKIPKIKQYWIITYDNVEPIKELYSEFLSVEYQLLYTAQKRYRGKEILIADPRLLLPSDKVLLAV
jgi:DNA adenine methylase